MHFEQTLLLACWIYDCPHAMMALHCDLIYVRVARMIYLIILKVAFHLLGRLRLRTLPLVLQVSWYTELVVPATLMGVMYFRTIHATAPSLIQWSLACIGFSSSKLP